MPARGNGIYEFGSFRLDPVERMLLSEGQVVALSPKALDLLIALVSKAGRVVDKDELMREVWPDTFVEENNLTVNISALRKALGRASSDQRYIQTVPRRGYRFVASVRQTAESAPLAPRGTEAAEADSDVLVGREPEVRILEKFLREAVDGAGRMIFITGEPGIGKTALSNAFLRRVRSAFPSATLCRGRCLEQYGAGEPYLPVLDSLSGLLSGPGREFVADVLRSHAPTWCLQFPAFFGSNDALERLYRETVGATKERMLREMVDASGRACVHRAGRVPLRGPSLGGPRQHRSAAASRSGHRKASGCSSPGPSARRTSSAAITRSRNSCWRCRRTNSVRRLRSDCLPGSTLPPISTRASLPIDSIRNSPP